jgi:hypothetical protein
MAQAALPLRIGKAHRFAAAEQIRQRWFFVISQYSHVRFWAHLAAQFAKLATAIHCAVAARGAAPLSVSASEALDLNKEGEATREAYGLNEAATQSYGKRCLMARRLVERGVRFVQLYIESQIFDSHGDLQGSLT